MKREAEYFLTRSVGQILVLALAGGMFVTLGALFSLLLSDGISAPGAILQGLDTVVAKKMAYRDEVTVTAWSRIIVSGMLGNALIGMAAFFATMANTLIGKFVPVFLVVSLFVAANLQHSPANMGYFSLSMAMGGGPGWDAAFLWNIIPAGIGNILGGALLVALPFWYALANRNKG